ncbi:MAG: tetratricopeptide repeat protein [Polyangiaceae bacterium]
MAEQHDESEAPSGPPDEVETEAQVAEPGEGDDAVRADATPVKKKKKKKRDFDAASEPIRDRNRRLRAEAMGGGRGSKLDQRGAPTRNLEASEIVDDAFARSTQAVGEWLKKNFNIVQWFVIAAIVGWVSYAVYSYRANRSAEQTSAKLMGAIRAEDALIGPGDTKADPQTGVVETRAAYPTDVDRLQAAEKQYRAIADSSSSSPAASFAKLGLASVLYDEGKFKDAQAAYLAVKNSPLAAQDANVRGRALEGLGMTAESLGDKDGAVKAFGDLSNIEGFGFSALGDYHKARLAYAAGENDKAKDLLQAAQKALDTAATAATGNGDKTDKKPPASFGDPSYLQTSVRDLLKRIDPNAVTAAPNALTADQLQELQNAMGGDGANPGKGGLSKEQLNELLKHMGDSKGGGKMPPAPPASAP